MEGRNVGTDQGRELVERVVGVRVVSRHSEKGRGRVEGYTLERWGVIYVLGLGCSSRIDLPAQIEFRGLSPLIA